MADKARLPERRHSYDEELLNIETSVLGIRKSMSVLKGGITVIKKAVVSQGREIEEIKKRVNGGFDARISVVDHKVEAVEDMVEKLETHNDKQHEELKKDNRYTRGLIFSLLLLLISGFLSSFFLQQRNHLDVREQLNGDAASSKIEVEIIDEIDIIDPQIEVP
jgi:hypothetical protein